MPHRERDSILTHPKSREVVLPQLVDATPSKRFIQHYFPMSFDLYGRIQSEPKQGFVLFDLTPANEFSYVGSCRKVLSKCCNDPLRPPRLSGAMRSQLSAGPIPLVRRCTTQASLASYFRGICPRCRRQKE
jgi:hypothetical protein